MLCTPIMNVFPQNYFKEWCLRVEHVSMCLTDKDAVSVKEGAAFVLARASSRSQSSLRVRVPCLCALRLMYLLAADR